MTLFDFYLAVASLIFFVLFRDHLPVFGTRSVAVSRSLTTLKVTSSLHPESSVHIQYCGDQTTAVCSFTVSYLSLS